MVELRVLGPFHLSASEGGAASSLVGRPKRAALLAYLAAAVPRGLQRRDKLLALFWPESNESHARAALNQALYVLRRALGADAILTRRDTEVGLDFDRVWCDVAAFETALDTKCPAAALPLYRGDLLDGFFIPAAPGFERWLDAERARLRQRAAEGAWALAETSAANGDAAGAGKWARRAAELMPPDEAVARRLMGFLHRVGDRAAALRAYEAFSRQLATEYEVEPSAETHALAALIRREEHRAATSVETRPPAWERQSAPAARDVAEPVRPPPHPVGSEKSRPQSRIWSLAGAAAAVVALAAAGFVAMRQGGMGGARTQTPRVVVLPFRNLGAEEDAHLTEGITDEITSRLAMVPGLSVVSGQTAAHYAKRAATTHQMAREVGADYVLLGTVTVLRSTSVPARVRIRPQLIRVRDEAGVWAAVLDEDLTETKALFALMSGIADRVVDELHVAVEAPQRTPRTIPTASLEAYEDYLRSRSFLVRTWSAPNRVAAIDMLERAVRRDSGFALAHAWLSYAHTEAFWLNALGADHLEQARLAGETALRLDPELPDALKAMGHYYYVCCDDYARALSYLRRAHAGRPGDAQVVMFIGNVYKRQGNWDEAIRYYERAATLDPRWRSPLLNLGQLQVWLRRWDAAERTMQQALSLDPQEAFAYTYLTWIPLLRDGDTVAARHVLDQAASASDGFPAMKLPFQLELLRRNYQGALALAGSRSPSGDAWDEWLSSTNLRRATAARLLGDSLRAREYFDSARVELESERREAPAGSRRTQNILRSALAVAYAGSGRRDSALAEAAIVMASDPPATDAISGPISLQNVALAYVLLGENERAIAILERLVSIPARLSPALLRLEPLWDPLRRDPRFERLTRRAQLPS
ncbi:MAG TPA: tetratricopeptide repeat protein [Gemmatimonadaceae bacterium]|nr:tetratricopeptide repeat protein [Gemmatimonadaceae bacterium]